jgi:hypothetical protein
MALGQSIGIGRNNGNWEQSIVTQHDELVHGKGFGRLETWMGFLMLRRHMVKEVSTLYEQLSHRKETQKRSRTKKSYLLKDAWEIVETLFRLQCTVLHVEVQRCSTCDIYSRIP